MRTALSKVSALALATLLAGTSTSAWAANLVTNGDFETGDLSGWAVSGGGGFAWTASSALPGGGTFAASTGCVGPACTTIGDPNRMSLGQTVATVAGGNYTLDFDYSPVGGTTNDLNVLWNGVSVLDLLNAASGSAYTHYTVTGLLGLGGGSTLEFLGRQDPSFNALDNITVDGTATGVPEPATWMTMLLGFGLIGGAMRSRQQQPKVRFAF